MKYLGMLLSRFHVHALSLRLRPVGATRKTAPAAQLEPLRSLTHCLQITHLIPAENVPLRPIRWWQNQPWSRSLAGGCDHITTKQRQRRNEIFALYQHTEQRGGFQPPSPMDDDGYIVDIFALHDLVESGTLRVATRPDNYIDRRSDGYTEPLELFVLGTSHVSEASTDHVRRVLSAVRPQSVVVELCKSRAGLMMPIPDNADISSPLGLSGEGFASALGRSIRIGGQSIALLRAVFAWTVQGSMSRVSGTGTSNRQESVAMYGDFRAAREAAEEAGAQIVLGDRPLEITLRRTWEALSLRERLDLMGSLLQLAFRRYERRGVSAWSEDDEDSSAEAELRRKVSTGAIEEDEVEALITMLAQRFPSVVGPLVHERDMYLAWTLKRSRAVCGQRRVVGVVGRGHLTGVMQALASDNGGDKLIFKELAKASGPIGSGSAPDRSRSDDQAWRVAKFAGRMAAETAAGFALWELFNIITN